MAISLTPEKETNGHIVLTRKLADKNHHPAIDVLKSVSRVARDVSTREHTSAASRLREMLAAYEEAADLMQIGAYVPGSNPELDRALATGQRLDGWTRQRADEATPWADSVRRLKAALDEEKS